MRRRDMGSVRPDNITIKRNMYHEKDLNNEELPDETENVHGNALLSLRTSLDTEIEECPLMMSGDHVIRKRIGGDSLLIPYELFDFGDDNPYFGSADFMINAAIHNRQGIRPSIKHMLKDQIRLAYAEKVFNYRYGEEVTGIIQEHLTSPEGDHARTVLRNKTFRYYDAISEAFAYWATDVATGHRHLFYEISNGYVDGKGSESVMDYFYMQFHTYGDNKGAGYVMENLAEIVKNGLMTMSPVLFMIDPVVAKRADMIRAGFG